ncbi:acyl-CoA dehydrogenase family protein [Amycolatopsis sp. NPDC005232]|uniref:acyl-CoA dehydrogenase family protein n=1 Tax=Amycolatopsis sp. NPDC005232 TaxID=3157027 RepID=UPI0033BB17CA
MAWDFSTDPEFQEELDWVEEFVRDEVQPLDFLLGDPHDLVQPGYEELVRPLQETVKRRGLWACHLDPGLGGKGFGQVKLALMAEVMGRSRFGPTVFGCQAPDTGNSEILARYGTAKQKTRYLEPLLDNRIVSTFAMTEPHGGADPLMIRTTAALGAGGWTLNGQKWFATSARYAGFFLVVAITEPEASPHRRMSILIVPAGTPGIEILRNSKFHGEPEATHAHVRFTDVVVPVDSILGERGDAFVIAQNRLGGGRLHHAMRTIAQAQAAFDMMCSRALSRTTKGEQLAKKQLVQEKIADCWAKLRQFRLLVLETAWLLDQGRDYRAVRKNIAAVKATMPGVLHEVAAAALQVHGSLGLSDDMPFTDWIAQSFRLGLSDGPTEVHKVTIAREVLRDYEPDDESFPWYFRPAQEERARRSHGRG